MKKLLRHPVTPTEFSQFVQLLRVQTQYPGIQGIGFTRRFSPQERPALEHWARTKGEQPDFHVWPDVAGAWMSPSCSARCWSWMGTR